MNIAGIGLSGVMGMFGSGGGIVSEVGKSLVGSALSPVAQVASSLVSSTLAPSSQAPASSATPANSAMGSIQSVLSSLLSGLTEIIGKLVEALLQGISQGSSDASGDSSASSSASHSKTSSSSGGGGVSEQFLWKPESEKDGNLAILLPAHLSGDVSGVTVLDKSGNVLASGQGAGVGNGGREHFRFSKAGGEFPDGAVVQIKMKNGTDVQVAIPNTGARFEKTRGL